ncbi:MAG: 23S rRNA (uracil(1939)-C(5))-methyltransferase RlmD [Desulfuromonadales bacterium]|nr:23S rRNA (uracil(1939)-C(5))-methyltransferase RlmD [Desulfuromonadales bacterium]
MFIELEIETLTFGGRGLGRHNGKAVFVPYTAPGDRVRCRATHDRAHFVEAQLYEMLQPSRLRRTPPCPVAGVCGGCDWQHLPYDEQLRWKERLFHEQLLRTGVASIDALLPIAAAPDEWAYRNRMQFKCRQTQEGFVAGFYRHASHYVVDAPFCRLAIPAIQATYEFLRKALPDAPRPDAIPQVDVSCSDDLSTSVLLHVLPDACSPVRGWLQATAGQGGFAAAVQSGRKQSIEMVTGDAGLVTVVDSPPLSLRIGAGGFAQVNPDQNRRLVDAVVAAAALSGRERVLDLFCGVGNFTLPLARRADSVVGVESYAPAIVDAVANASRHAIGNVTFHAEPAEGAALRHGPFDLVLLDPPRTGAYPVMRDLLELRPRRILYVSCDPVTLTRDLQPLVHNGYRVITSRPFDLFPQTWHVESLTVLERHD